MLLDRKSGCGTGPGAYIVPGFALEQGNREESGIGCHLGIRLGDGTRKEMKGLLPCGPWPSVAEREREGRESGARAGRPGCWASARELVGPSAGETRRGAGWASA